MSFSDFFKILYDSMSVSIFRRRNAGDSLEGLPEPRIAYSQPVGNLFWGEAMMNVFLHQGTGVIDKAIGLGRLDSIVLVFVVHQSH